MIIYCCRDCGGQIKYRSALHGTGRCVICRNRYLANFILKGKSLSQEHINQIVLNRRSFKGQLNPNYKMGKPFCIDCNKQLSSYKSKRCNECSHKGQLNSMFGVKRFGTEAPNYKHGLAYLPYPSIFNKELKLKIRQRDNFTCQGCGLNESQSNHCLDIHHIDYNKFNCNQKNLITLCRICNIRANSNRDYHFAYYNYLMENINA